MITFHPATTRDAAYVAEHIRELDRVELAHTGSKDPERAIRQAIDLSMGNAITVRVDGLPAAVLGIAPSYLLGEACPWMLGTDAVADHPRELVRWARRMVQHWLTEFPILMNEVWTGNKPAVRFLRAAGFEFAPPRENQYGAEMMLFYARRT